jgi:hypothetical protein
MHKPVAEQQTKMTIMEGAVAQVLTKAKKLILACSMMMKFRWCRKVVSKSNKYMTPMKKKRKEG